MDFRGRNKRLVVDKSDDELLEDKIKKMFEGEPLFERLESEPKWVRSKAVYHKSAVGVRRAATYVNKVPMVAKVAVIIIFSVGVGGIYRLTHNGSTAPGTISEVAGVTDLSSVSGNTTAGGASSNKLPQETPEFDILMPGNKPYERFNIVRVSPGSDNPAYTYIDSIDSVDVKVSQQKLPKQFEYNPELELERVAKDFQATDIIQIDESKVYHGLDDATKTQTVIFIKDGLLVFIISPEKLSDDTWAGYILGLQKQ